MNFTEIMYQSALFTALFFLFNRLFNKFVFKNREQESPSIIKILILFACFASLRMIEERYATPVKAQDQQKEQSTLVSGQSVTAPVTCDVAAPLKSDFEFIKSVDNKVESTTITTNLAEYMFSSDGATLQSVTLLWQNGSNRVDLLPASANNFVVGLNQPSPMAYTLVDVKSEPNAKIHEIVYQAKLDHGIIQKRFVIYQDTYRVDLHVTLEGLKGSEQVRLFVPAPLMQTELIGIVNSSAAVDQVKLVDIALDKPEALQQFWFEPKVFGFSSKFFVNACFAASTQSLDRVYFKQDAQNATSSVQAILQSKPFDQNVALSWSFYLGPKTTQDLAAVSAHLSSLVGYGMLSILAKPLANLLFYTKQKCGNYGWAIILVALLLKLIMLPFTLRSERSLRQQAEFEKKRVYIQQKYKHDKAAMDQATAELIQKHGLPIFSGCLPMLLNIPVFIALNKVLTSSTELYGASFLWLPDLSAADPYYVLSVLTFVGMVFAPGIQTGPRKIFSKIGFALFLAAVTSYLASGLALFIVLNTLFGVVQNLAVKKISWLSARYA